MRSVSGTRPLTGSAVESAIASDSRSSAVPEQLESLWENITRIRVAMLTAIGVDDSLASRPMMTCEIDPAGTLWFFVADDGALARSVSRAARVGHLCRPG